MVLPDHFEMTIINLVTRTYEVTWKFYAWDFSVFISLLRILVLNTNEVHEILYHPVLLPISYSNSNKLDFELW